MKEKLQIALSSIDQQILDLQKEIEDQNHDFGLFQKKQKLQELLDKKDDILGTIKAADMFLSLANQ